MQIIYYGVSIYIQEIVYLLVLFCGIKTYPLCIRSTSFSIENGILTISNKYRMRSIPLDNIEAVIIIKRQTLYEGNYRFHSSRYHARIGIKNAVFSYKSIYAPAFANLSYNMEAEVEAFKSLFETISHEVKIPIKGTGNYDEFSIRDFKYFKDCIFFDCSIYCGCGYSFCGNCMLITSRMICGII